MERAKRFKATIGVDDETQGRGSVGFILEIFRSGAWQSVFTSPVLRGGDKPQQVDVDITGATQLRWTVTDGGDNINSDHAAWGGARLE
jgi:hypothetical protein